MGDGLDFLLGIVLDKVGVDLQVDGEDEDQGLEAVLVWSPVSSRIASVLREVPQAGLCQKVAFMALALSLRRRRGKPDRVNQPFMAYMAQLPA